MIKRGFHIFRKHMRKLNMAQNLKGFAQGMLIGILIGSIFYAFTVLF
jgi:hypothetical protein